MKTLIALAVAVGVMSPPPAPPPPPKVAECEPGMQRTVDGCVRAKPKQTDSKAEWQLAF